MIRVDAGIAGILTIMRTTSAVLTMVSVLGARVGIRASTLFTYCVTSLLHSLNTANHSAVHSAMVPPSPGPLDIPLMRI